MPKFHNLEVIGVEKTIRDAVVVTLKPPSDADFRFTQGQYLTFRRDFEGEELRRSYSICAGRYDGLLQVGIKRVDGGAFSTWANTELQIGDTLEAMPPMGSFYGKREKLSAPHILGIAAGSGITPVLSILRTELACDPSSRFTLIYVNRNINTIMFRTEIGDLKDLYMGRLNVIHILTEETQDIDLFHGRLDREKCAQIFSRWIDISAINAAYICGPEPMTQTVAAALEEHGLPKEAIRFELFASAQPGRARARPTAPDSHDAGVPAMVTLGGETRSLTLARNTSILDAARDQSIDAPFACCAGVCSTCKAKVLEGEVEMRANHALEDYEVEAGYVLTCQAYVKSEKIVIDYDQAGH